MDDLIEGLTAVFGTPRYNDGEIVVFSASEHWDDPDGDVVEEDEEDEEYEEEDEEEEED